MAENKRIDLIDDDEPVRESLAGLVGGVDWRSAVSRRRDSPWHRVPSAMPDVYSPTSPA